MNTQEILSLLKNVKKNSDGSYRACCPAHDDEHPSLSISYSKEKQCTLLHCHAGCKIEDILNSLCLKMSDLYENSTKRSITNEIKYPYYDEKGKIVYYRIRKEYSDGSKKFFPVQANGQMNLKGVQRLIYNLPNVLTASTVFFVEGEKCADIINQAGYTATTLDCGANSKWLPQFDTWLQDKDVILIPDNDKAGMKYAQNILNHLPTAKVIKLPNLKEKEDIYDWLTSGHTMEEIEKIPPFDLKEYFEATEKTDKPTDNCKQSSDKHETQAEALINMVMENETILFHDSFNETYAACYINGHREIQAISSQRFSRWLYGLYYKSHKKAVRKDNLTQALETLSAIAQFENEKDFTLSERVAKTESAFWYDLTNEDWQAIKITSEGWAVENVPPILFRRYTHQKSHVTPCKNGDLSKLLKYINIQEGKTMFLCWVVSCFIPDIPHAMPIFHGEKGSAKTTACMLLKRLIDPSKVDTLELLSNEKDLTVNCQQHWFLPFDNLSMMSNKISDKLCRIITGAAIQERKLYTNSEECIYTFQRCLAINGINNVISRSDLLDRSILIELSRVSEDDRQELSVIKENFERDLPEILGGVLNTLSKAMKIYPTVQLNKLPRMADFAKWCYAIAEALGIGGQTFLNEYNANQKHQNRTLINSNIVSILIVAFMKGRAEWYGKVSDLYNALVSTAESIGINPKTKEFPARANVLSRRLKELKSNLEEIGITYDEHSKSDGNYLRIKNEKISPLPPFPMVSVRETLPEYDFSSEDEFSNAETDTSEEVDF